MLYSKGSFLIHEQGGQGTGVRHQESGDNITVTVDPAAGAVELVWYNITAQAATVNGAEVPIEVVGHGQRVRFDGRQGTMVNLVLDSRDSGTGGGWRAGDPTSDRIGPE
jgi:hypothetical protein